MRQPLLYLAAAVVPGLLLLGWTSDAGQKPERKPFEKPALP